MTTTPLIREKRRMEVKAKMKRRRMNEWENAEDEEEIREDARKKTMRKRVFPPGNGIQCCHLLNV